MSNITIHTGNGLHMIGLINILQEELPEYSIRPINFKALLLYEEISILDPDLVIVDMEANVNISKLVDYYKNTKVKIAAWTSSMEKEHLIELFKLDLHGYFFVGMELNEIKAAIESILHEKKYIHPYLSDILIEDYIRISHAKAKRPIGLLSKREWEVLEKMVSGHQNEVIANDLFISDKTAKNHVASILRKLQVKDRTNAVLTAIKNNWVNIYSI